MRSFGGDRTSLLKAEIAAHEPERPRERWTCPQCGQAIPAGVFFCEHAQSGEVLSRDMRPRIRR